MAAPVFAPPHPVALFRILKQAWRDYAASGNAAGIDINTIANQLATAATTVAGTVYVDKSMPMPATVSVQLKVGAVTKATQTPAITSTTGAYTTTFPANTLTAGSGTAVATVANPAHVTTSNTFTVT
jgi:hypothetical protein